MRGPVVSSRKGTKQRRNGKPEANRVEIRQEEEGEEDGKGVQEEKDAGNFEEEGGDNDLDNGEEDDEEVEEEDINVDERANKAARKGKSVEKKRKCSAVTSIDVSFEDEQEIQRAMVELPETHQEEKARLLSHYVDSFAYWKFQLGHGFNLLFYGFGSKRGLLEQFASEALTDGAAVVVNGFLPNINLKQVLTIISDLIWQQVKEKMAEEEQPSSSSTMEELLSFLAQQDGGAYLYLILHNIDGPSLRTIEVQRTLAAMAACSCVRLLASIDNVTAPLLWDKQMATTQLNWWWQHTPTYANYAAEAALIPPLLTSKGDRRGARSAAVVLRSLTPNARSVFRLLAEFQLKHPEEAGLPFHRWYTLCREKFLVSSEPTLRAHQTEFRDHELLRTKRGADGRDCLYIPLPAQSLSRLLEEMEGAADA